MTHKRTLKALEELVKTEHMAVAALDSAMDDVEDGKLRRQYRKWRDAHAKQGEALNDRIADLGGQPIDYEVGSDKGQASLWGKITGMNNDTSIMGMRVGAERGIKRYIDHIDDIEDPKALNVVRRNLEAKQDEIRWYDDQAQKEREHDLDHKLETTKEKVKELEVHSNGNGKKGGLPFPLLLVAGALGAAAFFLLRKGDDSEFDDYDDDAFQYEDEATGGESTYSTAGASTEHM